METKTTTVPVVSGALGLVKKGTENYIRKVTIHQVIIHETFHGMNSVP